MVVVKGPLFSEHASGNFGKAIQFICGKFAKATQNRPPPTAIKQREQQTKFLEGANLWSNVLLFQQKQKWNDLKELIISKDRCIRAPSNLSGYNLWQLYFLKHGVDGWENYPNPPN